MAKINSINNASFSFTSDTSITSTLGDITATAGNIVSTLGDITATAGNITATLGNIVLTDGLLSINGSTGTDGQIILAKTADKPLWGTVTAGTGMSVGLAANALTLTCTANALIPWATVNADAALVNNNAYINIKTPALLTMTLPAAAAVGTMIILQGSAVGDGGWKITTGGGQNIQVGNQNAATSIASSDDNDSVTMICTVADTTWNVVASVGNLTIV